MATTTALKTEKPLIPYGYVYTCTRCHTPLQNRYVTVMHKPDDPTDDEPICYRCAEVTPNEEIARPSAGGPGWALVGLVIGVIVTLIVKGMI